MKPALLSAWQTWALLSACFAALTAIFAKVGIENINSDFATLIRTVVILVVMALSGSFVGAHLYAFTEQLYGRIEHGY